MFASLKCFVVEKKEFLSTSTLILKSVCVPGYEQRYVVGENRGYRIALSVFKNWLLTRKNYNFIEIKVHLIHSKKVPLIHNAVLMYAMKDLDWWPC